MSNNEDDKNKKTVTIRGVDKSIYEKAVITARETGRTVGEVVNQSLTTFLGLTSKAGNTVNQVVQGVKETGKSFVQGFEEAKKDLVVISDVEELTVTRDEILQAGKPISFRNIKRLTLNIDQDTLNFVDSIIGVDELIIPPTINKIILLQKCKFVKKISTIQ
ncbi:hypothetical protein [Acidianus sp. HS-5]|uniref:hypothetical protein n=1 Tax=Acidianus sp. HS-5 TaxID=2886040 RepID=UPI001F19BB88|nr:hypothetical protein [Acidianus sp. HS-5]BDC17760.1 hypothetical protein HS5_06500 [Acidianus sp. HS-5]